MLAPRLRAAIPSRDQRNAKSGATMVSPHYISEYKSDLRGIKHGWYVVEDGETLSLPALFPSREECINRIA